MTIDHRDKAEDNMDTPAQANIKKALAELWRELEKVDRERERINREIRRIQSFCPHPEYENDGMDSSFCKTCGG